MSMKTAYAGFRVLVLVSLAATTIHAQTPFGVLREMVPPSAGTILGSADFDGDGVLDLLTQSTGIYVNDGNARFSAHSQLSIVWTALVAVADLNGDGLPDVIGGSSGSVYRWINQGSGVLSQQTGGLPALPPGTTVRQFAAADVDGDGDVDIVIGVTGLPLVLWLNGGGGVFFDASSQVPALSLSPNQIALVDLDADGDRDLLITNNSSIGPPGAPNRLLLVNDGSGTFTQSPVSFGTGSASDGLALGDVNGDLLTDIVFHSLNLASGWALFLNTGAGFAAFGSVGPPGTPALLDIDGNGADDIVSFSGATGPIAYSVVPGGLSPIPLPGLSLPAWAPAVGDFDQDGDRDVIVTTAQGHRVLLNTAPGLTEIPGYLATKAMWSRMFAGDLEGDGDADLIGCDATAIAIVRNGGDGRLTWDSSMPCSGPCPVCPSNVVIHPFDADQDGDLDVYVCNGTVGAAMPLGDRLVRNNGTSFTATITYASNTTLVGAIDSGDIDGDGDNDLVISRFPFGYFYFVPVQIFFNQSNGVFGPILSVPTSSWSMDVKLVDVDADGDLDLVEANYLPSTSATSALLFNNGSGSFSPAPGFPGLPAQFVSAGDLDGDGDTDLLLDGRVYVNAGNGTFSLGAALAFPPNFYRPSLLDSDGDGDLDVLEGGRLYLNTGSATFSPPTTVAPPVNWAAVADFDRDGDQDFVIPVSYPQLFSGLGRQLVRGDPARPGRLASLDIFGPPLGSWQIYSSMAPGMLSLPPWGTVWIDPASAQLTAVGAFDATGRATASALVPSTPSVIGVTFYVQAVVQGPTLASLTNREILTVTAY
jgi:hypothetical protein